MKITYGAPWVSKLNPVALVSRAIWPHVLLFLGAVAIGVGFSLAFCGCSKPTVGPFVPKNVTLCSSDWDCKDGYGCGFPDVDTKAVCLPDRDTRWDLVGGARHVGPRRGPRGDSGPP